MWGGGKPNCLAIIFEHFLAAILTRQQPLSDPKHPPIDLLEFMCGCVEGVGASLLV